MASRPQLGFKSRIFRNRYLQLFSAVGAKASLSALEYGGLNANTNRWLAGLFGGAGGSRGVDLNPAASSLVDLKTKKDRVAPCQMPFADSPDQKRPGSMGPNLIAQCDVAWRGPWGGAC